MAKLCKYKIRGGGVNVDRVSEVGEKFELLEGYPVVLISGCEDNGVIDGKFMAGIARAAHRMDAVIVANGLHTGIEPFVQRRQLKYIGVAPEP